MNGEGRIRQHTDTDIHTMRDSNRDERKKKKKSYYHRNYNFYIYIYMTVIFTLFSHLFFYSTQQYVPSFRKNPLKIFYNTSLEFIDKANFVCMVK